MVREFEGATEKDAIERAIEELNLNREEFDVEIIEEERKGLFRKGNVRIKVYLDDREEDIPAPAGGDIDEDADENEPNYNRIEYHDPRGAGEATRTPPPLNPTEDEVKTIRFLTEVINRMGYEATVNVIRKEDSKVVFGIESKNSGILIGRKGKNLDALQLLANVYANKLSSSMKVVVDAENYRIRREENLVRLATKTAEQVRKSHGSRLLEPMNPFERRLIHTTLNTMKDIETKSEGDGLYKQVRVFYKGN
ncbi:MAG: protein jag [Spirochaetales bacterium]|nr:protein jag [Spirochaetales bacterium]